MTVDNILLPRPWAFTTCLKAAFALIVLTLLAPSASAQTTSPEAITVDAASEVCTGETITENVSITLPPETITDQVDVFLLFDDTGSFADEVSSLASQFTALVASLESSLPTVEFGFGVGRFEDYGGQGADFSGETTTGRPFTLNQPIITVADAGGITARDNLIATALGNTAPGFGGDGPESAIAEGLFQVATGAGFDGNGDGDTVDSGDAGETSTQTNPGFSGDVPAFDTNVLPTSGSIGGVGFRPGAQRIVLLATDICSIAAFDPDTGIPANIFGAGGSSEPVSALSCSSTPGFDRFGFISDAKSFAANTISNAVVPSDAAPVQQTVDALNALGIQVVGVGPDAAPTTSPGPAFDESVFLSALARLTGAIDTEGDPIVVDLNAGGLASAVQEAIEVTATSEVDITLDTSTLPSGLAFDFSPSVVPDVSLGGTASFAVDLIGDGSAISGAFDIQFKNAASNAALGTVPVTVECGTVDGTPPICADIELEFDGPGGALSAVNTAASDPESGIASATFTTLQNLDGFVGGFGPFVEGDVQSFDAGSTSSIDIRGERISYSAGGAIVVTVENGAGLTSDCDPVVEQISASIPERSALLGNYPNPAVGSTTIEVRVAEPGPVRLEVYDLLGRKVSTLIDREMMPGTYQVEWTRSETARLSSGTYLYRLEAGDVATSRKLTLLR